MNFKITIEHQIEGVGPFIGAYIHKGGVPKKTSPEQLLYAIKSNTINRGAIIEVDDFGSNYRELLEMLKVLKAGEIRVTIASKKSFYEVLESIGKYSAKEQGMDLSIAEQMFGSQMDFAIAIGTAVLEAYIQNDFYFNHDGESVLIHMGGEE